MQEEENIYDRMFGEFLIEMLKAHDLWLWRREQEKRVREEQEKLNKELEDDNNQ